MATPQQTLEAILRVNAQGLGVLKAVQEGIAAIASKLKGGGAGGPKDPKSGPGIFGQLKGVLGTVSKTFAVATAVVGAATAALLAVPLAVLGIVNASEKFVGALNPSLVEQYDQELRNLNATIGFGLTPVIAYATKSVKEWAGILLPTIERLRPIVERVSAAVSGAASGLVRFLNSVLQGMAGRWEKLLPLWESMIDSVGAFFEILSAVNDVLNAFDQGFSGILAYVKTSADNLRQLLIGLAVVVTKLIGAFAGAEGIAKFRKSLTDAIADRKNPRRGLLAAPQDSQITGIEDIGKQLSARAFMATAGAGAAKKSDTDLLEALVENTAGIKAESLETIITNAVVAGFKAAKKEAVDAALGPLALIRDADVSVRGVARGLLGPLGFLGD